MGLAYEVVSPATRSVRIHRPRTAPAGPVSLLLENESITGEDVLPGFSCHVREFFENA
jgi:Uma2 family endonuclease